jgi:phage terminase large subunit
VAKLSEQVEAINRWYARPDIMVRELFGATPDPWQDEVLRAFPRTPRIAMKASKGPGKSCVLAWLAWNFLLTRPHPNIAATSISGDNLRDGLWKEMAHWRNKSDLLKAMFEWQTERIFAKEAPATWFMSARSWSKSADPTQLGNTLAGLHSDYIMFLIDESGSIPVPITMSAEAALSSCKEGHILQAGNTNTLDGALYDACVRRKQAWHVVQITGDPDNPMRSSRIDIEWAREMIRDRGREDPYVKLLVLGEWPSASINALIGPEEVEVAMKRNYRQPDIDHAPRILGVDVADEGDDASVIFPRQGLVAFKPHVLRNVAGEVGAGQVARVWNDWNVDAVFIDNTGGYAGVWRSTLRAMNRAPIPIGFAEEPLDRQYFNRRAEMYFEMVRWIKDGGALPDVPELVAELTQTTYTFKGDRMILEPKKLIKAKIGRSPDRADALALTFAEPVASKAMVAAMPAWAQRQREAEYDPFAEAYR